ENLCTTNDRCRDDGVCEGTWPVCGDGIRWCERCDDGPANGTPESCCTATCTVRAWGSSCADDGDLCTHDACLGTVCSHLVEPEPACAMPHVGGGATMVLRQRSGVNLTFKWGRGADVVFGDPTTAAPRLCVYDQRYGGYDLIYDGAPSTDL